MSSQCCVMTYRLMQTMPAPSYFLGDELTILVENMGRVGYGKSNVDFKGLIKNVTLDSQVLIDWQAFGLPFNNTARLTKFVNTVQMLKSEKKKVRHVGIRHVNGKFVFLVNPTNMTNLLFHFLPLSSIKSRNMLSVRGGVRGSKIFIRFLGVSDHFGKF